MAESLPSSNKYRVELIGRDCIELEIAGDGKPHFAVVGCSELVALIKKYQNQFHDFSAWPLPTGNTHSEMLLRELLMRVRNQWKFPYEHAELCHCRLVQTQTVDQAILAGAHTPEKVSRQTSASTACGTCRPDVQKIIEYRLKAVGP